MDEFESYKSYLNFAHSVRTQRRFVYDEKVRGFIQTVVNTSSKRIADLEEDQLLFRAQRGCNLQPYHYNGEYIGDEEWPYSKDRMIPIRGLSHEGRANPKGITYIYLAKGSKKIIK